MPLIVTNIVGYVKLKVRCVKLKIDQEPLVILNAGSEEE